MKILIILITLILIGCGQEQNPNIMIEDDSSEFEIYYTSLDGSEIDGSVDDIILECISKDQFSACESICISDIFPEYKRYDLFMTYYMPVDECEFYIFSSDGENSNGSYEFYKGEYNNHSCTNFSLEDQGDYYFNGKLTYLYLYDNSNNLKDSIPISSPGANIFRQLNDNHEFFLRQNCKKLEDITDEAIEGVII